nr:hypothetical protein [Tanacetum cinerariifolium]
MSEKDQTVDIMALPKFDMPSHESRRGDIGREGYRSQAHSIRPSLLKRASHYVGFPGFRPVFKDTEGNVSSLSIPVWSYHREWQRPYQQDLKEQHTIHPLLADQAIPNKTEDQKEVEVADPKIVATRERKARADAMKIEKKKRGADEGRVLVLRGKGRKLMLLGEIVLPPLGTFPLLSLFGWQILTAGLLLILLSHREISAYADEGESSRDQAYYVPEWFIHRRCRVDNPMWCRELMIHLAPPAAQEESNALENSNPSKTYAECGDTVRQLLEARETSQQSLRLYLEMSEWFKKLKNDHSGFTKQVQLLEGQISELSQVNKDQALKIKEFDDTLARKDSALVYAERINTERDKRKRDSHEYKQSLSKPFNLAIQVGWGKGITEERSEEELLGLMSRMEHFDAYPDKKMRVEYDKLFEKKYPFVEKISRDFRYTVSDLLKVYPDSPPSRQAPPSKSSSGKAPSFFAPRKT